MEIRWLQAVIDLPAEAFDSGKGFWTKRAAVTPGEVHPDHDEFVHLLPASGDIHLELQRIGSGTPRAHLDLLVDDIPAWVEVAQQLGGGLIAMPGHAVLETPGGMPFCIVPAGAESQRPPLIDEVVPHAVDQICLDVPFHHFEADVQFWHALTGWEMNPQLLPEFQSFDQPPHLPLRILIQRLGSEDVGGARAHLDFACGDQVDSLTKTHLAEGAALIFEGPRWHAMCDPSGMPYCLTRRQPRAS